MKNLIRGLIAETERNVLILCTVTIVYACSICSPLNLLFKPHNMFSFWGYVT